jgi:hypothetical protein
MYFVMIGELGNFEEKLLKRDVIIPAFKPPPKLLMARVLLLLSSVGPAESRLNHCSLPRIIVLNPTLVPPFISRGAPRQTA